MTRTAIVVYSLMIAGTLLGSWWLGINPWRVDVATTAAGGHVWGIASGILAALPLMILLVLFEHFPPRFLSRLKDSVDDHLLPLLRDLSLVDFAILSLCAGVGEELLFRGLAQQGLEHWLPESLPGGSLVLSIFIAGVLFGACHWINDQYALMAALVGMYLGAEFVATGTLLAPMTTHACYDFFALWYLTSRRSHPPATAESSQSL